MPNAEHDKLMSELVNLSASALPFVLEHIKGDAFYKRAYKLWCERIPRVTDILEQLYYHGDIFSYSVRGLDIKWRTADSWGKVIHERMLQRVARQFERITVGVEPMERNEGAEILEQALDYYCMRGRNTAGSPDRYHIEAYTERHYKRLLDEGIVQGQQAHYMHMKLEGGMFQFELVPPPISVRSGLSGQRGKKSERIANSTVGKIAQKWSK
jgi:hypothetical protein